jgi:hypothetical protein
MSNDRTALIAEGQRYISDSLPARLARALFEVDRELAEANQTLIELRPDPVLVEGSWFPVNDLPQILGNFMRSTEERGRELKAMHQKLSEHAATIEAVKRAYTVPGSHPEYHFREQERLSRSWPTLAKAIARLLSTPTTEAVKLDPDPGCVVCGLTNHDVTGHDANVRARREAAKAEAERILKPKSFRIGQRRDDLGGIRVESSAVDYWDAVHALVAAKLPEEGGHE